MTSPDEPQTPRTDAVAGDGWSGDAECVSADFARQLELELRGSLRIIDELGVELRKAQEQCVNVAKSLGYAITLLEVEHDWDKCLQYLIAVRDKNDAAIKP